jgi:hypothetical protein
MHLININKDTLQLNNSINYTDFLSVIAVLALVYAGHFSRDLHEVTVKKNANNKIDNKANFFI